MENINTACWVLKNDLIVSRQDNQEGVFYVIKDPSTERFFRFKEIESYIASQCDGEATGEIIRQRAEEKFNISLTQENIAQFIDRLYRAGLLVERNARVVMPKKNKWQLKGDIFYIRCPLVNPDRFLDWLLPKFHFLFTPAFIILSVGLILIAVNITIVSRNAIMNEFYGLLKLEYLVQAWLIMIAVVTLHEFAHGLTCKYFGGHVREMGFLLIFFQPAFYCNVSDAWLFPKKAHRMWVTFAGAFFEIFLWAVATITWRVTDFDNAINHFALVVTVTSALKIFFNMNPLIKLDGYYLLSDWVEIPNLRQKASDFFKSCMKSLFGFGSATNPAVNPRLRIFFILYSIFSVVYIYWILTKIVFWVGDMLVSNFQAWGFAIFVITLALFFRKPLGKMFFPALSGLRVSWSGMRRMLKLFIWTALLTLLPISLFFIRMELKVSGPFVVAPQHNADIRAEAEGIIDKIFVDEGDEVMKGDLIARISDRDYRASLRKTKAEIESKSADLRLLKSGAKPEEIEMVRNQILKSKELLSLARSQLDRDEKMVAQKLISIAELENTQTLFIIREKEFEELKGKLKLLESGSRTEEREAVEASIRALQAHEQFLQDQLQSLEIRSPINGVVTTHKLKEKIGENVKKGDLVAKVYAMKLVNVEIAIPEKEISDVAIGQRVVLKALAYPR
jgi:putative peptide zinc metalloprotease protein